MPGKVAKSQTCLLCGKPGPTDGNYCHPCKLAKRRANYSSEAVPKPCHDCGKPRERYQHEYCRSCADKREQARQAKRDKLRRAKPHYCPDCGSTITGYKRRKCDTCRDNARKIHQRRMNQIAKGKYTMTYKPRQPGQGVAILPPNDPDLSGVRPTATDPRPLTHATFTADWTCPKCGEVITKTGNTQGAANSLVNQAVYFHRC